MIDVLEPISLLNVLPEDVKIPKIMKPLMNIINKKWNKEKATFSVEDFIRVTEKRFKVGPEEYTDYSLSEEETQKLIEICHENGTSINSVLLAASLIAKNQFEESKSLPNKVGIAVDVREKLIKNAGESCSLLASGIMVNPKFKNNQEIWDLAKQIQEKTIKALNSNKKLFLKRIMSPLMDPTIGDAIYMAQNYNWEPGPFIRSLLKKGKKIPIGVVITNLGGIKLKRDYRGQNPLRVQDAVFYPPVGVEEVIELGASTLAGKLHIVSTSKHDSKNSQLKDKVIKKMLELLRSIIY